jgi:3-methyladenine DNA glycosylase AlkD
MWLIRAAILHRRGWKGDTEISRVLELFDRHWNATEFFVAKAIGWPYGTWRGSTARS